MGDTIAGLRHKIGSAGDLQSVVRSMKAVAASSIGQYERSVRALADYYRTVELGLSICFRESALISPGTEDKQPIGETCSGAVVFGSDQGLVGRFNDVVADFAVKSLAGLSGDHQVWSVGERVHGRLADAGLSLAGNFEVPKSVAAIAPLVTRILLESESRQGDAALIELRLFYNRPDAGAVYEPVCLRLLPLDEGWRRKLTELARPAGNLPEIMGERTATLRALIREYLFVSIFRACADSLASENASRLAAMQRADKNIEELLDELKGTFHRMRQSGIDEELFDVIAGFEALVRQPKRT